MLSFDIKLTADKINLIYSLLKKDKIIIPIFEWENKLITIARLSEEKNLERALKAFEIFSKKYKNENWEWNIVGYGKLESLLKESIKNKNLNVSNSEDMNFKILDKLGEYS